MGLRNGNMGTVACGRRFAAIMFMWSDMQWYNVLSVNLLIAVAGKFFKKYGVVLLWLPIYQYLEN
jgi:hypothetical protein